jgi:large subunit ribosomal protein L10
LSKGEEVNMKREEKENLVGELNGRLKKAQGTFLLHYQGLKVEPMGRLRRELRTVETEFQVVKNRLLKLASEGTGTASMTDAMEGPSAIALAYGDPSASAKVLVRFSSELEPLKIMKGQISGKPMDLEGVKRLAELPSREVLLAQTLSAMQAVPASFVRVLNGIPLKFLYALKAIEAQKAERN